MYFKKVIHWLWLAAIPHGIVIGLLYDWHPPVVATKTIFPNISIWWDVFIFPMYSLTISLAMWIGRKHTYIFQDGKNRYVWKESPHAAFPLYHETAVSVVITAGVLAPLMSTIVEERFVFHFIYLAQVYTLLLLLFLMSYSLDTAFKKSKVFGRLVVLGLITASLAGLVILAISIL